MLSGGLHEPFGRFGRGFCGAAGGRGDLRAERQAAPAACVSAVTADAAANFAKADRGTFVEGCRGSRGIGNPCLFLRLSNDAG